MMVKARGAVPPGRTPVLNQISKWLVVVSVTALASQVSAFAAVRTVTGRVTASSSTQVSVLEREVVTLKVDERTVFTKMITQKPWEQDSRLDASALRVGRYVAVHVRKDDNTVAGWVQIATDMAPALVTPSPLVTSGTSAAETRTAETQASSADVMSEKELLALVSTAKSREDHLKLSKHFAAMAERYEADAVEHTAMAKAYRARPTASETKRPGSPDTSAHCDRLAEFARSAAKVARELGQEHVQMADAAK